MKKFSTFCGGAVGWGWRDLSLGKSDPPPLPTQPPHIQHHIKPILYKIIGKYLLLYHIVH